MGGVTALTLGIIVVMIPGIIGSYLVAQRRSHALQHIWFTALTVILAVGLVATILLMPRA